MLNLNKNTDDTKVLDTIDEDQIADVEYDDDGNELENYELETPATSEEKMYRRYQVLVTLCMIGLPLLITFLAFKIFGVGVAIICGVLSVLLVIWGIIRTIDSIESDPEVKEYRNYQISQSENVFYNPL